MFYAIEKESRCLSQIEENAVANYLKILEILIDGAIDILKIQALSMIRR